MKQKVIKLGVSGALGKMGQRLIALAQEEPGMVPVLALEAKDHPGLGRSIGAVDVVSDEGLIKNVDGLIEFSSPGATLAHLERCVAYGKPMVIGTTGFSEPDKKKIRVSARRIPVVFSPNMSIGVNLLFSLVREAAGKLPPGYTVSMSEAHHVHKKDAPSGTAKYLADVVRQERRQQSIDIKSIREGEIVGDHWVVFDSPWDTLTLMHSAKTRDIFAHGALAAMKFALKQKKGLFSMADVLKEGLK